MEKKETKRILKTIEYYYSDGEEHKRCPVCGIDPAKLEQEIEKARKEGYRKGAKDMFDDCECFPIPKDVLEEFIKNNFNK